MKKYYYAAGVRDKLDEYGWNPNELDIALSAVLTQAQHFFIKDCNLYYVYFDVAGVQYSIDRDNTIEVCK